MVSLSFNRGKYESIVGHFNSAVTRLENLAASEEAKAAALLQRHRISKDLAAKASTTATNIGKLIA